MLLLGHTLRGRTVSGTGLLVLVRVALLVLQSHSLMGRTGCGTGLLGLMRVALLALLGHTLMGRRMLSGDWRYWRPYCMLPLVSRCVYTVLRHFLPRRCCVMLWAYQ